MALNLLHYVQQLFTPHAPVVAQAARQALDSGHAAVSPYQVAQNLHPLAQATHAPQMDPNFHPSGQAETQAQARAIMDAQRQQIAQHMADGQPIDPRYLASHPQLQGAVDAVNAKYHVHPALQVILNHGQNMGTPAMPEQGGAYNPLDNSGVYPLQPLLHGVYNPGASIQGSNLNYHNQIQPSQYLW